MRAQYFVVFAFCLVGCSGGESGSGNSSPAVKDSINGKSSITFSGAVNRTTRYGTDPNTQAFCTRFKSGETTITLSEKGENRNNSGWMKDGLSFSFYQSTRPQDVSEIDGSQASVFAVVKEMESGGTFSLNGKCTFNAIPGSGNKLSMNFRCPDLVHGKTGGLLTAFGWIECVLVEQDF